MAAKRRTKAEIEAEKFDKATRGMKLVPTRSVPMSCPLCGSWLDAQIKALSSNSVDSDEEGAGILFELVLFATHDCLED